MGKWRWLDDADGGIITRDGVEIDPNKILCFLNANDGLLAALREIAHAELVVEMDDLGKPAQGTVEERRRWRMIRIAKTALAAAKGGAS